MKTVSVVILTKNEEKNIVSCIKSVSFADEVIVVDDHSTDKTVELAKKTGAKIYERALDDFSSQRNFGLSCTTSDWVLFIDADERVSYKLQTEILSVVRKRQ